MTREEQIIEKAGKDSEIFYKVNGNYGDCFHGGFIDGAKWADEHPDSKHIYTKQQLIDMGFAFTTNGDIVTPDQLNEDLKKYLKYQKRKFIEKAEEWLWNNFYEHPHERWLICSESFDTIEYMIERFKAAMEE